MRRREFVIGAGCLAAATTVRAQTPARLPRIGILSWSGGGGKVALREELAVLGHVAGKDIDILDLVADEDSARLAEMARELAAGNADIIVAFATPAVHAAKRATQTIPIVMGNVADPIGIGLVESLSRPGGNITGVTFHGPEVAPKRLELLREMVPGLTRVGFLGSTRDPNAPVFVRAVQQAAQTVGVNLRVELIDGPEAFAATFDALTRDRIGAVMIQPIFVARHSKAISELAVARRLPTISDVGDFARAGGLMSYGAEWTVLGRRAAHYVDRILKGAKPSDLPIELPTVFELVLNLKTARTLGLSAPPSLLVRADEVIE